MMVLKTCHIRIELYEQCFWYIFYDHVNSLWPSGVTSYDVIGLSQHWYKHWFVAWRHQAIAKTNVEKGKLWMRENPTRGRGGGASKSNFVNNAMTSMKCYADVDNLFLWKEK